ncbi:hypothetical protein TCAL_05076 [Tigriopus californicus]|uniref:Alpha-galactosidase n=1 Tax=Tigriopus californicus TaxID=6832 RepID=A0A553NTX6_TIGCA|nr:alpha-N-acetylgalactosaminidase-like [Tigriopus californicus]TRY68866.1 hypothetical protein TCAL_05076 [Tigriopus californicus]
MKARTFSLVCLLALLSQTYGLDNGLALTPPMGWMSWERFRCNTDCKNDPLNCISENLFKTMADEMVLKGFKDAGYEYIIIDDCWLDHQRDENGKLTPDPERFPSGIKALADYVHNLGLKFGIYEDYGNFTCGGYPGILGYLEQDAQTFAEWEVDYIKLDGCYVDIHQMDTGYPDFGDYLNKTGRPIVYSCSWPAYWEDEVPDYPKIAQYCNLWRNYGDIQDSWTDVLDIIDHYGDQQNVFAQFAGPGQWNDPDMLIIGNFALSMEQSKLQMAVWAVLAAPLIMSNDLRNIRPEFTEILTNRNVIKINQDPLGHQGRRMFQDKKAQIDIYVKQVLPMANGNTSGAVVIMYRGNDGTPVEVEFTPEQIGLSHFNGYTMFEVFENEELGLVMPAETVKVKVNPNGAQLLKLVANSARMFNGVESSWHPNAIESADSLSSIKVSSMGKTGWKSDDEL